jgi:hypothetical protein
MGPTDVPRPRERENWPQSAKIFALIIEIHSIALFTTKQPVAVFGNESKLVMYEGFHLISENPREKLRNWTRARVFQVEFFVTNRYATTHVRKSANGFYTEYWYILGFTDVLFSRYTSSYLTQT